MWFHSFFRSLFYRLENLNFNQLALLTAAIVAVGFILLRGYGSRSNY
jgi:hypothetical protein